jgi:chromate transporter
MSEVTTVPIRKIRYLIFLKDVLILALTSFGGPQVHLALFMKTFVQKRGYLTEAELMELTALCSILPGPTSTQTITALGYRIGGANLAYLTLIVWITPAVFIMTAAAFGMNYLQNRDILRFIQPIGIGFLIHAGYVIGQKVIKTETGVFLMVISSLAAYVFQSPWICPIVLIICGSITSFDYKLHPKQEHPPFNVPWPNFFLFVGIFLLTALVGHFTDHQFFRLLENFYRNGSLVFGGGTVLGPLLYTEFVEFKHLVREDEFLSGMALSQAVPGPVFSLTSYLGTIVMKDYGFMGQLGGSIAGALGIFLPGTFLIFFVIRIWGNLKTYRPIRASLDGINAASTGLTLAAAITLLQTIVFTTSGFDVLALLCVIITVVLLQFSKIPPYLIFIIGMVAGLVTGHVF